jgi:type IV pilus assembly protein PilZ
MAEDKRENPRDMSFMDVSFEQEGLRFEGRISDLSGGGFYIDTLNPLPVGSLITFRFNLPGGSEVPIAGEGSIAWQHPFLGMGVRFTWLSDEDRNQLDRFLSQK